MTTLFVQDGQFIKRWGWAVSETTEPLCVYQEQYYALSEIWPNQRRCAQVRQRHSKLDAAIVELGLEAPQPWAMMPLKGRKLDDGQKVWVDIKKLPRDGKGCSVHFVEPARASEILGTIQSDHQTPFAPPYGDARRIIADHQTFVAPAHAASVKVEIKPEAVQAALGSLKPEAQIKFNPPCFILIEVGRTLTAIDINAAPTAKNNLAAVPTIARAIWRENLAGLIVIDFLRPDDKRHRQEVTTALKAQLQDVADRLPQSVTRPQIEVSTMDHRGLVIIERERLGVSRFELSESDPPLIAMSKMLETALAERRPKLGQRLTVSPWAYDWLHRTAHRRRQWQSVLAVERDEKLDQYEYQWTDE